MNEIKLHDKVFEPYIMEDELQQIVKHIAKDLTKEYSGKKPIFIGVLNGVVLFISDLLRLFEGECELSFIQLSSYDGVQSTGSVNTVIDFQKNLSGRDVIIVEDIVDTGATLEKLYDMINQHKVASCKIITLFLKPDMYQKKLEIHKVGKEIPNKFIVGYGLDYNGIGRNYPKVYQLKE